MKDIEMRKIGERITKLMFFLSAISMIAGWLKPIPPTILNYIVLILCCFLVSIVIGGVIGDLAETAAWLLEKFEKSKRR